MTEDGIDRRWYDNNGYNRIPQNSHRIKLNQYNNYHKPDGNSDHNGKVVVIPIC